MSFCWIALLEPGRAPGPRLPAPLASAQVRDGRGAPAGLLAAWPAETRPPVRALRIDARAIDPEGPPGRGTLALAPWRMRLPFDDPAVQGARRRVLAGPPRRLVSTLLRGDSLFAGALTLLPEDEPEGLVDDPFARIVLARRIRVGAGLLGSVPAPAGPVIERYGSGSPWPWDRFAGAARDQRAGASASAAVTQPPIGPQSSSSAET